MTKAKPETSTQQADYYQRNYAADLLEMSDRYDMLLKIIKDFAPQRFLDVGCGDGSFAIALRDNLGIPFIAGVDIAEEAIELVREKGLVGFSVNIDQEDLPFENSYFDFVFCGDVIEHLYDPDHLLEEIHRVLNPGGRLLLATPNLASWFNRISILIGYQPIFSDVALKHSFGHLWKVDPMGHLRLYTYRGLRQLIEAHQFKVTKGMGIGINSKIGFGMAHPLIRRIANFVFRGPSINSGILILAEKQAKEQD